MFFGRKKHPPIKSLIAQGTVITGRVVFADGLRIDGEITGDVVAAEGQGSILVVSETGKVSGEIRADLIVINGVVNGPVFAADLLELQPKAKVEGDVSYKALEMHQGATISGQLQPMPMAVVAEKTPLKLASSNG
ncbi:MAG TPA: polymer-forming cytoskeletal protein [Burkholderiaceae bacterium]|nr:polymer-forming cytoskeletal protein [Burkholderiaceae bacterium]